MRLPPNSADNSADQIQRALEHWAKRENYSNAGQIPIDRARELIDAVVDDTGLPRALVTEAILTRAGRSIEASEAASAEIGTPEYQGARVHTPIGTESPLARLMSEQKRLAEARASAKQRPKTAIEALAATDRTFEQTVQDFEATRIAITDHARPKTLEELNEACVKLLARFQEVKKRPGDKQVQAEVIRLYKDILSKVTRDRGVFLTKGEPSDAPRLDLAEPRPDPGGASSASEPRGARYAKLARAIGADGTPELDAQSPRTLGRIASLAVDGASGDSFLLDYHGRVRGVFTVEGYAAEYREAMAVEDRRTKLRSVSDPALARLGGEVSFVSLLEDRDTALTRVYPTKWLKSPGSILHRRVIADGPFKGVFLDDLVNELAPRGKGFAFDPKKGPSTPISPREGEPWITTAEIKERGKRVTKLYVRIPFEQAYTPVRQALRRLSELDPSIRYHEGTKNTAFYFGPERYKIVRDVLKGVLLSPAARDQLQAHFDELTRIELAANGKALERHTAKAIGGFKERIQLADGRSRPVELTYWQRKSIAMLEALGYAGVLALDTGMGKTLAAIGVMQELRNRHGEERPFLIVCPKALRGNFAKEIYKFLEPKAAAALAESLVVLDYKEFARASAKGEPHGRPFSAQDFGAVFFDESQWLRKRRWKAAEAALAFDHPRKMCISASVMRDSFDDMMTQASIAANVDLGDRTEGKELRAEARKFKLQSCVEVGGRTLGVKQEVELLPGVVVDPKHDLYTWVKRHIIYADKRMDDQALPRFRLSAETLVMPKAMEDEYRRKTARIGRVLRGMVSLYRDKGVAREYVDLKGRKRVEIDPAARDKRIGGVLGVQLRDLIQGINNLGNTPARIERAGEIVWKHLEKDPRSRAVLFSDSAGYVLESARLLSEQIPGKIHAACLANEIRLYQNGRELERIGPHTLPFRPGSYRKDPSAAADPATNRQYGPNEWQQFALSEVIGPNQEITTATMYGPTYQEGQNLQWANVGIHLDRDTWNRQNTLQREGRLWRKDQKRESYFYNLDWVFRRPEDRLDRTLDEIRAFHEEVGESLFDDVIVTPQKKMTLGEEWSDVRSKDALRIDFDLLRYGVAPSVEKAGALEMST